MSPGCRAGDRMIQPASNGTGIIRTHRRRRRAQRRENPTAGTTVEGPRQAEEQGGLTERMKAIARGTGAGMMSCPERGGRHLAQPGRGRTRTRGVKRAGAGQLGTEGALDAGDDHREGHDVGHSGAHAGGFRSQLPPGTPGAMPRGRKTLRSEGTAEAWRAGRKRRHFGAPGTRETENQ